MEKVICDFDTTSAGDCAMCTVADLSMAASMSACLPERFQTIRSGKYLDRFTIIGNPITPSPINPTVGFSGKGTEDGDCDMNVRVVRMRRELINGFSTRCGVNAEYRSTDGTNAIFPCCCCQPSSVTDFSLKRPPHTKKAKLT